MTRNPKDDCENMMCWIEYGEHFTDCKVGKMSEDGKCRKNCRCYKPEPKENDNES